MSVGRENNTSAADRAYAHLRDAILSAEYGRGHRLREEHLAKDLGVSRTPIREALRRLGAEGLVVIDTHRGAEVASWSEKDVDEIYSIRALLEAYGARLAATQVTDAEIEQLINLMDLMELKVDEPEHVHEVTGLNFEFHRRILEASGIGRLVTLFSTVVEFPVLYRAYRHYSHDRLVESLAEHRTLVLALSKHDEEWAEAVMRTHVLSARAEQRRIYKENGSVEVGGDLSP